MDTPAPVERTPGGRADAPPPGPGGSHPPPADEVRASIDDLVDRFLPEEGPGGPVTYALQVAGFPGHTIRVTPDRCHVAQGLPARADAHLRTDASTWLDIVTGRIDGIRAFTSGRLQVRGDLQLAVQLETMFTPGPEATRVLRTRWTPVRGGRMTSWVGGTGTPVVLVHGLAASKVTFVPTLDDLADDHEVHTVDLPGFGRSDKPLPLGDRYSAEWFADRLLEYLDHHELDGVHLVGNSMGGRVVAEVAMRDPRRVHGITGLCPAVAFDEWQRLRPVLGLLPWQWVGLLPVRLPTPMLRRGVDEMFHDPSRIPTENLRAAVDEAQNQVRDRGYRMAVTAAARGLVTDRRRGPDGFWRRLADLDVPSLWVWGRSDPLVSSRYGERVASTLRSAQVEVWGDCGHVPQFEVPDRTHELLRSFIDRTEAAVRTSPS